MPNLMHIIPRPGTNAFAPTLPIPAITYFYDDFNRADTQPGDLGPDWDVTARWQILNQHAHMTSPSTDHQMAFTNAGRTDYTIYARCEFGENNIGGLIFRGSDTANYWRIRRPRGATTDISARLEQSVDGVVTEIADLAYQPTAGAWWTITLAGTQGTLQTGQLAPVTFTLPTPAADEDLVGFTANTFSGAAIVEDFGVYDRAPN